MVKEKSVWKFQLDLIDFQSITMPYDSEVLTVQTIGNIPFVYVLVDPLSKISTKSFELYGTGHTIDTSEKRKSKAKYIGTFQVYNGQLVYHLFEQIQN